MPIWIMIRTFIAIFFVLFGLALIAGRGNDPLALLGALLAALGITFLWRLWVAMRTGS
jgi:hypothetical protein